MHEADDEAADSDWLDSVGFTWDGDGESMSRRLEQGWEVVCGMQTNSYADDYCCARSLCLLYTYPGPPKISATLYVADNPGRRDVTRLMAGLGFD